MKPRMTLTRELRRATAINILVTECGGLAACNTWTLYASGGRNRKSYRLQQRMSVSDGRVNGPPNSRSLVTIGIVIND